MIGNVIALLAAHLAAGTLLIASLMSFSHRVPRNFQRFCAAMASIGGMTGLIFAEQGRGSWLMVTAAAVVWYVWLQFREQTPRAVAFIGAVTAPVAMIWFGVLVSQRTGLSPMAGASSSLSSMLLLGAVTVTMILGHWYLVDVQLAIAPLRQGAWWLWAAIIGRWFAVGVVLIMGGWEALRISHTADIIYSTAALFFMFRSLVGLGAPLLLTGLIWQTVKIRSTQSATGLLYVTLVLVLFGELVAHFLQLMTGFPL